nr:mitochondrial import inner membrane translocase subunit tim50 [Quercus suber]
MLTRAVFRVNQPAVIISSPIRRSLPPTTLRLRAYASKPNRKSPPPPPVQSSAGRRPPPPIRHAPPKPTTTSARQTSPDTSLPQDETWKPKDGIQFGQGVAAAAAAGTVNVRATTAGTPVAGTRPSSGAPEAGSSLANEAQEPTAQRTNADEPVSGSARQMAHDAQAALENTETSETSHSKQNASQIPVAQRADIDEPVSGSARGIAYDAQAAVENTERLETPQPLPDAAQEPLAQSTNTDRPVIGSVRQLAHDAQAAVENSGTPDLSNSPQRTAHEPIAQRINADEPVPRSVRQTAHNAQVAAENTEPPETSHLSQDQSREPIAQEFHTDKPVPGSARQIAHDAQSTIENTDSSETSQSRQLPDLRQGIPSTFDFEFGAARKHEQGGSQEEKLDLTASEATQGRQRSERDYDSSAYETSTDRRRNQMANYLYAIMALATTLGGLYLARPFSNQDELPSGLGEEEATAWTPSAGYTRVRARFGSQLGYYTEPSFPKLLPDIPDAQRQPYTLVLSLEDLLIHSSWDRQNGYRVAKRPGMDYFIRYLSQYYELVLFTSTPVAMADPVIKKMDPFHFMWPLGREATKYEGGEYVKDLSYLNRPLAKTLVIDTVASHVKNQPENAIILPKWEGDSKDPHSKDLVALIPFLEYIATMGTEDVRSVLKSFEGQHIPDEFAKREAEARKRFMAQFDQQKSSRKSGLSLGSLAGGFGLKASPAMAGGMVLADGSSVAEGLAKGKMLSDQIREQGQKQYEQLEKQIRENGAQWLKEEEEAQKAAMDAQMKDMKRGAFSIFGGSGKGE